MMRWLNIRVMLGSGLIKLRGDPCWRNFSCMDYHYETTCVPNFLSYYFHQSPLFVHRFEVLMNHISQLISPLLVIGFLSNRTRILRILSGFLPLGEMLFIQLTGNYGFLNMLTVLPCFSYFDDDFFNNLVPSSWISFALTSQKKFDQYQYQGFSNVQRKFKNIVDLVVLALVGYLSMNPIKNLMSDRQVMNTSYDPFHIIGTYGAFGTVGKDRYEVVLQGTHEIVIHDKTVWYEIEFNCKPTKLNQMPCQISPYHHRIDWQIWFTGFQPHNIGYHPWLAQFVSKLLKGDLNAWNLLNETKNRENFYKDDRTIKPPKFIKADMYRYIFTDMKKKNINWWRRRDQIEYLPPVSLSNPNLIQFLNANGFK